VLPPQDGWAGGPVELDRVIPPSGNLMVARRQFWLSPLRAGQVARFWADVDVIHISIGGSRVKSVRSHLSVNDLAALFTREPAVNAGPSPLPAAEDGDAFEVDRVVSRLGLVSLGNRQLLAAEIHGGRQVGIRIEEKILMFFDLHTRTLLRTRPNPLTTEQVSRLRGLRKAGPPPRPSTQPVTVRVAPPTPAWSWCAVRRWRSAGPTSTRPSPSRSPRRPWPSTSATARAVSRAAPPTNPPAV